MALTLLSSAEAQRLTQRIKITASTVRDNLFKLRNLVDEAKSSNVWNVLGHESWTAYLVDTLGSEPMRLGRDERRELVEYLSGEGMSTRAIAPIVGASVGTIHADRQVFSSEQVEPEVSPRAVTGLDGKTYTAAAPVERRSSILDDARNAGWQLRKAAERLERIHTDDRFTKNKVEILAALQPHLDFADEVLAGLAPPDPTITKE